MSFQIRHFFAGLMALLAVATNSLAAGENEFRAGIAAYEAGQFDVAAQAFRRSLGEQTAVGTLVNLGLAEWQRGRPGDAILAWEQASWLNPFDRAAAGNLLYVHNVASVNPLELTWYEEASTWLPANWWTGLAGGSLWLAVALVTVPGFLRRRKAGWQQTVAAMALGIFLLSLAPSWGIFTRAKIAIVLQNNSALRLTPTQTAETFAPLPPGEPVRALRQRGNYFFVHTQIGNGWIDRGQIEFLCPN